MAICFSRARVLQDKNRVHGAERKPQSMLMATMEKLVYTDRAHDHLRMDRGVDLDLVGTCAQVTIPIPTQIRFINPMVNPHVNLC